MKKDMIVYDSQAGLPYLVKEIAGEALLCSNLETLSRLEVDRRNGDYNTIHACGKHELEFIYLCDVDGAIPAQILFSYLLYVVSHHVCGTAEDSILDAVDFLIRNNVTVMPWRDRTIELRAVYRPDEDLWDLEDYRDLGICIKNYSGLDFLPSMVALVLENIKNLTIVENVRIVCEGRDTMTFMEKVLEHVTFKQEELILL